MSRRLNQVLALTLALCMVFEQSGFAQIAPQMPIPAYLQGYVSPDKFRPMHLRSLSFDQQSRDFSLYLDKGDVQAPKREDIRDTTRKVFEYFQVGLRLPNSLFWVNLRPDSPNDIIDPELERTDLGKVLLEADLQLKKDVSRFTSPETAEGRQYWDRLYERAESLFGQQDVDIPTYTRPWIVPGEIIIRQGQDSAYIYKATLNVMLEQDYLKEGAALQFDDPRLKELNDYSSELIRQLIIPRLTREVNSAKKYAALRQVYYSLVLAQWFKAKFRLERSPGHQVTRSPAESDALLASIDSRDLSGLESKKKWSKQTYFKKYKESFHRGEYDVQESVSGQFGLSIRRYFSGGTDLTAGTQSIQYVGPSGLIQADPAAAAAQIAPLLSTLHAMTVDQEGVLAEGGDNFAPRADEKAEPAQSARTTPSGKSLIMRIGERFVRTYSMLVGPAAIFWSIFLGGVVISAMTNNIIPLVLALPAGSIGAGAVRAYLDNLYFSQHENSDAVRGSVDGKDGGIAAAELKQRWEAAWKLYDKAATVKKDNARVITQARNGLGKIALEIVGQAAFKDVPVRTDKTYFQLRRNKPFISAAETVDFGHPRVLSGWNIAQMQPRQIEALKLRDPEDVFEKMDRTSSAHRNADNRDGGQSSRDSRVLSMKGAISVLLNNARAMHESLLEDNMGDINFDNDVDSLAETVRRSATSVAWAQEKNRLESYVDKAFILEDVIPFLEQFETDSPYVQKIIALGIPKIRALATSEKDGGNFEKKMNEILTRAVEGRNGIDDIEKIDPAFDARGGYGSVIRDNVIKELSVLAEEENVTDDELVRLVKKSPRGQKVCLETVVEWRKIETLFASALRGDGASYRQLQERMLADKSQMIKYFESQAEAEIAAMPRDIFGIMDDGKGYGYDVRGNALKVKDGEVNLKPVTTYLIGKALATLYAKPGDTGLITGDQRWHTPALRLAMALGTSAAGVNIDFSNEILGTGEHGLLSGENPYKHKFMVQISGSHGIPEKNGLKIKVDDNGRLEPLYVDDLARLYFESIARNSFRSVETNGTIREISGLIALLVDYYDRSLPQIDAEQPIVIDCRNSALVPVLKLLVAKRGLQNVLWLNDTPDPAMPGGIWDPSKREALVPASEAVKKWNQELAQQGSAYRAIGFVFDGDGDRATAIIENGSDIPAFEMTLPFYQRFISDPINQRVVARLLQADPDYKIWLVADIRATSSLTRMIDRYPAYAGYYLQPGYPPQRDFVRWRIEEMRKFIESDPALKDDAQLKEDFQHFANTYFTAEASGHQFFHICPNYPEKVIDAGIAVMFNLLNIKQTIKEIEAQDKNLNMPAQDEYSLVDLFKAFPQAIASDEIRISVPNSIKWQLTQLMTELMQKHYADRLLPSPRGQFRVGRMLLQAKEEGAIALDGLVVKLKDGSSALFRKSNTGEQATLMFEGSTPEALIALMKDIDTLTLQTLEGMKKGGSSEILQAIDKVNLADLHTKTEAARKKYMDKDGGTEKSSPLLVPDKRDIVEQLVFPSFGVTYHAVISDAASDLDTVAGVIAEAYRLQQINKKDYVAFPVFQGVINDETRFVLKETGVDTADFIYLAEKDVEDLIAGLDKQEVPLRISLVDHSAIAVKKEQNRGILTAKISSIIDHHPVTNADPEKTEIAYAKTGASATLVYERFVSEKVSVPRNLALLLLAAILSDTKNLAVNVTERDTAAAVALKKILGYSDQQAGDLFTAQTLALNTLDVKDPLGKIFNEDNRRYYKATEDGPEQYSFTTLRLNPDEAGLFADLLPRILEFIRDDIRAKHLAVAFFNLTRLNQKGGLSEKPEELYVIGTPANAALYLKAAGIAYEEEKALFERLPDDLSAYRIEHKGLAPRKQTVKAITENFASVKANSRDGGTVAEKALAAINSFREAAGRYDVLRDRLSDWQLVNSIRGEADDSYEILKAEMREAKKNMFAAASVLREIAHAFAMPTIDYDELRQLDDKDWVVSYNAKYDGKSPEKSHWYLALIVTEARLQHADASMQAVVKEREFFSVNKMQRVVEQNAETEAKDLESIKTFLILSRDYRSSVERLAAEQEIRGVKESENVADLKQKMREAQKQMLEAAVVVRRIAEKYNVPVLRFEELVKDDLVISYEAQESFWYLVLAGDTAFAQHQQNPEVFDARRFFSVKELQLMILAEGVHDLPLAKPDISSSVENAVRKRQDQTHLFLDGGTVEQQINRIVRVLPVSTEHVSEAFAQSINKTMLLNDFAESVGIGKDIALKNMLAAGMAVSHDNGKTFEVLADFYSEAKLKKFIELQVASSSNPAMVDLTLVRIERIIVNSLVADSFISALSAKDDPAGVVDLPALVDKLMAAKILPTVMEAWKLDGALRSAYPPGKALLTAKDIVSDGATEFYRAHGIDIAFSLPADTQVRRSNVEALQEYQRAMLDDMARGQFNYRGTGTRQDVKTFFEDYYVPTWYSAIRSFVEKEFNGGKTLKAIVTNGIGANDQFMWSLVEMYNRNRPEGAPVWYHIVTARDLAKLKGLDPETTLAIEISRSGSTWEGVEAAIRMVNKGFTKRITLANGGALVDIAKAEGVTSLIIGMSPDIGGRNMHRKTAIYYTAQTVAGMFLPQMDSTVFAALNHTFDTANDFANQKSAAIAGGKFIHAVMKLLGVEHIALVTNSKQLALIGSEWSQYIMEGSNKEDIISLAMHDLTREPAHVLRNLAVGPAGRISMAMVILDKAAPTYAADAARVAELKKRMPVMEFIIDSRSKLSDNDVADGISQKQQAAFDILWTDMVTVLTSLLRVDANSNPNVKVVREMTASYVGKWQETAERYATDAIGRKETDVLVSVGNPGSDEDQLIGIPQKQKTMLTEDDAIRLGAETARELRKKGLLEGRNRLNIFFGAEGLEGFAYDLRNYTYKHDLVKQKGWILDTGIYPLRAHKGHEATLAYSTDPKRPLLANKSVDIFFNVRKLGQEEFYNEPFKDITGKYTNVNGANVHQTNDSMTLPNIQRAAQVSPTILFEFDEMTPEIKLKTVLFYVSFIDEIAHPSNRNNRDGGMMSVKDIVNGMEGAFDISADELAVAINRATAYPQLVGKVLTLLVLSENEKYTIAVEDENEIARRLQDAAKDFPAARSTVGDLTLDDFVRIHAVVIPRDGKIVEDDDFLAALDPGSVLRGITDKQGLDIGKLRARIGWDKKQDGGKTDALAAQWKVALELWKTAESRGTDAKPREINDAINAMGKIVSEILIAASEYDVTYVQSGIQLSGYYISAEKQKVLSGRWITKSKIGPSVIKNLRLVNPDEVFTAMSKQPAGKNAFSRKDGGNTQQALGAEWQQALWNFGLAELRKDNADGMARSRLARYELALVAAKIMQTEAAQRAPQAVIGPKDGQVGIMPERIYVSMSKTYLSGVPFVYRGAELIPEDLQVEDIPKQQRFIEILDLRDAVPILQELGELEGAPNSAFLDGGTDMPNDIRDIANRIKDAIRAGDEAEFSRLMKVYSEIIEKNYQAWQSGLWRFSEKQASGIGMPSGTITIIQPVVFFDEPQPTFLDWMLGKEVSLEDAERAAGEASGIVYLPPILVPSRDWIKKLLEFLRNERKDDEEGASGAAVTGKDGGITSDKKKVAGIDFRTLPVLSQPAAVPANISLNAPAAGANVSFEQMEKKWQAIEARIQNGPMPYQEIKEYVVLCSRSAQGRGQMEKVSCCIAGILRLEEEAAFATAPELKEILAALG